MSCVARWCSGLTYRPVTPKIVGSNPIRVAIFLVPIAVTIFCGQFMQELPAHEFIQKIRVPPYSKPF